MATYDVTIPFTGSITITVAAETRLEAQECATRLADKVAMNVWCEGDVEFDIKVREWKIGS